MNFVKLTNPKTKLVHYVNLDYVYDIYREEPEKQTALFYTHNTCSTEAVETPEEILAQVKG